MFCVVQLYREVRIMKMLDHPNIGTFMSSRSLSSIELCMAVLLTVT